MIRVSQLFGSDQDLTRKEASNIAFDIHVSLICTVQSYNSSKRTVDAQPCIRERYIPETGQMSYINYPVLINVPVAFPSAGGYILTMPIQKGDECLVVFNDIAFDNWWLHGNIQNPIEQRRHDLSDGIAIFGLQNQSKISNENEPVPDGLGLYHTGTGYGLEISATNVTLTDAGGSITLQSLLQTLSNYEQRISALESAP